jgi:multidrug resistance protein, MATE family
VSAPTTISLRVLLRPRREDLKAVGRLAVPVAVIQIGLMAMGVADTIMVGWVSPEDLAGVALGNLYFFIVAVFGMGLLMALDPLVAQAMGAGDSEAVARAVQRGLILAGALGLVAGALLLPAGELFLLTRQPAEVIPLAVGYAWWSIPGTLPFYGFVVLRQALQGMSRVRPILWTIVLANGANIFLNWILIWGNLGVPRLGAIGSAMGTSISRWLMFLMLLGMAWPLLRGYVLPIRARVMAREPLLRMIRLGAPVGFQFQFEYGAFAAIGLMAGWVGTTAMAAHQIALNLASVTFMVPMGIAAAAAVRVGQAIGEGEPDRARRAAGASIVLGMGFMVLAAAIFLLFPGMLGGVYTKDPGVLAVVVLLIPIAGFFQVVDGLQAVSVGVLRGIGDTQGPMWINIAGFWGIGIPLALWLAFGWGWGTVGLWWGIAVGLSGVAFLLLFRVKNRLGRVLSRIIVDP